MLPTFFQNLLRVLLIMLAGGLGTGARFLCSIWVIHRFQSPAFWGTFCVNFCGCFLIGFLSQLIDPQKLLFGTTLQTEILLVGFLGGFTTFSSFSLETIKLLQSGATITTIGYALGSLIFCLLGTYLGIWLAKTGLSS
jgi:fluoride exporter